MTNLLRGELRKIATTRTLLGYAAAGVALTIASTLIVTQTADLDKVGDKQEALAGLPILLLLFALVGAAGEYRHRTAAPAALVARRDRGALLLARAGAYLLAGVAVGGLMTAVALALGLPLLGGERGPALDAGEVAAVAGGSLVAAGLSGIMGVAIGALVRNQVAGVIGVLIFAFIVNPLIASIEERAEEYTPIGAAAALAGQLGDATLAWGAAALVLAAWTVPLLVAAIVAERRRDMA